MESTQTKTQWAIDPTHSEIQFKVKHLVISTVTGTFNSFEGTAETQNGEFEGANIQFSLDVASVDTNQEQRDEHLKSSDFFDAEKYPKITFQSTSFTKKGEGEYSLKGNLTIKDVTKEVELNVEHGGTAQDPYGNTKAGFEVTGKINRKEFGLTYSAVTETGGVLVGDEIKIIANVQVAKQA
jgi:polyisoprenoid-binding protein YceI